MIAAVADGLGLQSQQSLGKRAKKRHPLSDCPQWGYHLMDAFKIFSQI